MKPVFRDLYGQQLTNAEVEGTGHLPARNGFPRGELLMFLQIHGTGGGPVDACWHGTAERLLAAAPPRQPVAEDR